MQAALIERRQSAKQAQPFWDELNLAQKFAVAELQRYGYQLNFVRHASSGNLAVLVSGNSFAAVNHEGEIDTSPNMVFRP